MPILSPFPFTYYASFFKFAGFFNLPVIRVKDLNKKANSVLCAFHPADPVVKTYLIKMYCLSLYGCQLWSLSSKSLNALQVAPNKIQRKVWNLPSHSHKSIVHRIANVQAIYNIVF